MNTSDTDSARWKQIDELLDALFDLAPDQRPAFLDQACGSDEALRKEVERLLAADERARSFIEAPAFQDSSEQANTSYLVTLFKGAPKREYLLGPGTLIDRRYEIRSKLGKGGMGEVWHAYDVKLQVDVALKSLRVGFKTSQDPVEAFRREVRSAREVISPNVCRIFDLVVEDDLELISMEYIDGVTLLAMLAQKGPLEVQDARDIAVQFLAGLEAIHQAGLVHRDLKPENIMITRTGRVVVMDFGISQPATQVSALISGTRPYMSPEQLAGAQIDNTADVFSAGVVLAEMIHTKGTLSQDTRELIWDATHKDPMLLPESPWKSIIARAVAANAKDRFQSAGALARALEEASEGIETIEERKPYPGLTSFTTEDTEYFFGRELEVEAVLRKLQQFHMMVLAGPSGAGKTSFLRAGLIPALPEGWGNLFLAPGDAPLMNLAQVLGAEFHEDAEVIQILNQWRSKQKEGILIIDRFEELFTLNGPEVQSHFAELIASIVLDSDVRVLLSMRDDFLLRCYDFAPLSPIFAGLTPLGALSGSSLRRALVQPALKCGYRFENETLVDEIITDVEKERGALPLMAFAAARLWEKRNRDSGLLTRDAYHRIGGVEGALAQYAEAAMNRIGAERQSIVREIFRNLITAQNTRAARDTEELLSVFDNRKDAEEVLRILIDARLLTSFEATHEGELPRRRVEIIHESLLSAWPRLVRWQTQDADSAQLRDQLRQASEVWEQRSRSEDLLWTGTAFLEFQAWRDRYPGGLTTTEEAFSKAMTRRANKKRTQRRIAMSAIFVVLLAVLAVISNFWRESTIAKNEAVVQAKRAEAGKALAAGRTLGDADPTTKLAYALASLESHDTPEARRFALQAVSEGPIARVLKNKMKPLLLPQFSPDGKWIALGGVNGVQLIPRDGSPPITLESYEPKDQKSRAVQFSPDSELVIWRSAEDPRLVKVWSLSQRKVVRTLHFEGSTSPFVRGGDVILFTDITGTRLTSGRWSQAMIRVWKFDHAEPTVVGRWNMEGIRVFDVDPLGQTIVYAKDRGVFIRSLDQTGIGPERLIGNHKMNVFGLSIRQNSNEVASLDHSGELRLWSMIPGAKNPVRAITINGDLEGFGSNGSFLVTSRGKEIFRWDLTAPEDADPLVVQSNHELLGIIRLDSEGRWMAVPGESSLALYHLSRSYPYIFRTEAKDGSWNVRFTPDGRSIVNGFKDAIRMWNMPGEKQLPGPKLWKSPDSEILPMDVDPFGKYILVGTNAAGSPEGAFLISMSDGKVAPLKRCLPGRIYDSVSLSPAGKFGAGVAVHGSSEEHGIEIWDLQSGNCRVVEESKGKASFAVRYSSDGTLFSGDSVGNVYQWNLKDNSSKVFKIGEGLVTSVAITKNGKYVIATSLSVKGWDWNEIPRATSQLVLIDLQENKQTPITSHGVRVFCVAFDPSGTRLLTGDLEGLVRVGPITGGTPHLLMGHQAWVGDVVVHPGGRWIASTSFTKPEIFLWPMPQGKPLDTLSYDELLTQLRALTNVRVVADKNSTNGYRIDYAPFPGWETAPSW